MLKLAKDRIAARWIPNGYYEYRNENGSVVYTDPTFKAAIAYWGKSGKPHWHFTFPNKETFVKTVDNFFEKWNAHLNYQKENRDAKKAFKTVLKPGDILNTSWGYDQTNVEFYQVLTVKNNTVTIQEVQQKVVGADGLSSMAGYTTPTLPLKPTQYPHWENGEFVKYVDAPILTRKAQSGYQGKDYVKINTSAHAWLWDGKKHYVSWYA